MKLVLSQYDAEIAQIKDPKHRPGVIQEFEKAQHYMIKMTQCFDDLNQWFTAFGVKGSLQGDRVMPCKGCERCVTIHHPDGELEFQCVCSGKCEECNRNDVPKLVKVKE